MPNPAKERRTRCPAPERVSGRAGHAARRTDHERITHHRFIITPALQLAVQAATGEADQLCLDLRRYSPSCQPTSHRIQRPVNRTIMGSRNGGRPRPPRQRKKDDRLDAIMDRRSPDMRFEELRRWIREGGHNEPDVAEAVARRILEAGDLDDDPPVRPLGLRRRNVH
jgi:hypothetical protein